MGTQRNLALDRFRGLTMILMVIVNDLRLNVGIPSWLDHAPDIGYTIADVVLPFFVFFIAATYRQSFLRRYELNKRDAYMHFITRYLAILGVGTFHMTIQSLTYQPGTDWGALPAIAVAGLLALPMIRCSTVTRGVIAAGLLAAFQLASSFSAGFARLIVGSCENGGLVGGIMWAGMMLLGTVMIDLYHKGLGQFAIGTAVLAVLAAASLAVVDISKHRVSLSFVLVSVTLACVVFLGLTLLSNKLLPQTPGLVCWWGENPLFFYVLHMLLIGVTQGPFFFLGFDRPLAIALPSTCLLLTVNSLIAWRMHKKGVRISL